MASRPRSHRFRLGDNALHNSPTLIGGEKKCLVFLNGPAKSAAKLVLLESRLRRRSKCERMRVQMVVAEKLVETAVQIVRAGLGDHIDHGAGVATVFCVEGVGDNLELLDAVRRWFHGRQVGEEIVAVAAVHGVVIGTPTSTVDGDDASSVRSVEQVVAQLGLHTRLQLQKLINVALVKRQLGGGALVNDGAKLRRGRINDGRRTGDFDYIGRTAKLQGYV